MAHNPKQPSFAQGYARYADQAEDRSMRDRLSWAWNADMGVTGNKAYDIAADNDGELLGTKPTWDIVRGRQFLNFGGAGYVKMRTNARQPGKMTASFLVIPGNTTAGAQCLISSYDGGAGYDYIIEVNRTSARFSFIWAGQVVLISNTNFTAGQLYHVIMVRRGIPGAWTAECWVNGKQQGTAANAANPNSNANSVMQMGAFGPTPGAFFTGRLSEVNLWEYDFTPEQIQRHYNDTMAMWRLRTVPKWRVSTSDTAIKTINDLLKASAKTVKGVNLANMKTWNGLP